VVRIRITRKFANLLNGVDVSQWKVGDVVDTSDWNANVLIAEGWAEPADVVDERASVLIIDDDDEVREMLAVWLRQEGYEPVEARDGHEGLVALVRHRPALVLLDLGMPRVDGRQFRSAQRRLNDDVLATVPIVIVSGLEDADSQAASLGASAVLHKPLDHSHFVTHVAAQMRRQEEL
jgi:DNA-binding response OmpR family regulator